MMMKTDQNMEAHSNDEVLYDLLGFFDKKPVMQIKKSDVSKKSQSTTESKPLLNNTNKAVGKFVILKNQHIKKVCAPNVNLKSITKVPASSIINIKEVVAWSKLVTKIDADQVVTQADKKLLRTYSKKQDKTYQTSVNDDNAVVDKTERTGTLPVSNSKKLDVGVSSIESESPKLSDTDVNNHTLSKNVVEGSTENRDVKVCGSVESEDRTKVVEYSVKGDKSQVALEVNNAEMGKIKHFKEKTQQESVNKESIGKQIFEEIEKMDETNHPASDTESTSSNLQNRPKKRTKTKPNKRQLIRREIEKCLKQQSMKRSRRRRILEARQKSISCQTVDNKKQTNEISTQTEEVNDSETTDENMALLQLNDVIENMGVITQDVNFGIGPTMPGIYAGGKNMSTGLGITPVYTNIGYPDYFGQFGLSASPGNMCFDLVTSANSAGGGLDTRKVMFYNYLKKCDQTDAGGNIPLHIAVMASDIAEVKRQCHVLSLRSKPVDVPNISGLTPLHVAVVNGCPVELIDVLLENGADPLAMDNDGNTTLHLAVSCHSKAVLVHLLKTVQQRERTVDVFNYEGFTPLMLSVLEDDYDLVDECVNYGADPNMKDQKSGRTSLFHAVENNNESMVKLFIIKGANTKIKNFFGTSTHEATFELENIKPEIKSLVVGRDSCPSRGVNRDRSKKKKPTTPTAEKFPGMKNKLKTVRVLKVIKVNKQPLGV